MDNLGDDMNLITVKKEWNNNQLNAFCLNWLVILFNLIYDKDKIKHIFMVGGLPFSPSNSQINNWRKIRKNSSIFKDEYLICFVNGLLILNNFEKIDIINTNKVEFFYNLLIKIFEVKKENFSLADDEYDKLGALITFLTNNKITKSI